MWKAWARRPIGKRAGPRGRARSGLRARSATPGRRSACRGRVVNCGTSWNVRTACPKRTSFATCLASHAKRRCAAGGGVTYAASIGDAAIAVVVEGTQSGGSTRRADDGRPDGAPERCPHQGRSLASDRPRRRQLIVHDGFPQQTTTRASIAAGWLEDTLADDGELASADRMNARNAAPSDRRHLGTNARRNSSARRSHRP